MPEYAQLRLDRHGKSVARLLTELQTQLGEMGDKDVPSAIAFDAADFVWAAVMTLRLPAEDPFPFRGLRNHLAMAIIDALENYGINADDAQGALERWRGNR